MNSEYLESERDDDFGIPDIHRMDEGEAFKRVMHLNWDDTNVDS